MIVKLCVWVVGVVVEVVLPWWFRSRERTLSRWEFGGGRSKRKLVHETLIMLCYDVCLHLSVEVMSVAGGEEEGVVVLSIEVRVRCRDQVCSM